MELARFALTPLSPLSGPLTLFSVLFLASSCSFRASPPTQKPGAPKEVNPPLSEPRSFISGSDYGQGKLMW